MVFSHGENSFWRAGLDTVLFRVGTVTYNGGSSGWVVKRGSGSMLKNNIYIEEIWTLAHIMQGWPTLIMVVRFGRLGH